MMRRYIRQRRSILEKGDHKYEDERERIDFDDMDEDTKQEYLAWLDAQGIRHV